MNTKKLIIGILAHVDAGKTTLSEGLLYASGKINRLGRVDNKDAYLDTFELERARGITIFAKQARFDIDDLHVTLLDTPGHVDFSAEMERTLQVLDYAILVVSGADGIQGHTRTLWRLFERYHLPVFLFINKMDQNGTDKLRLLTDLNRQFGDGCIDFTTRVQAGFTEQLAMSCEPLMDAYLKSGHLNPEQIRETIRNRMVFPCYFGSALRLDGVEDLMRGLREYSATLRYPDAFGAKVFKITRDEQGNRLTHMKITGGRLRVKDALKNHGREEKVNQIRLYSGQKYEAVSEIEAGTICAVTGLNLTRPGEGFGIEPASEKPLLAPVLSYQILLPEGCDPRSMIPKLRQIEDEEPELHIVWNEHLQEIQAQIMGEVQVEILQSLIKDRFDVDVTFGSSRIVYKETIARIVEGVGHFEPLRHYAEVHLLLEPGEPGSGLQFGTDCSEDEFGKAWQRLVLTHLEEKQHKGVLTGSPITDLRITLVAGKAHNKHTEGGDFREATYRAVRQGLKEAESILLEPYYAFTLELPDKMVGRALSDIEKMYGTCAMSHTEGEMAFLAGSAPVSTLKNYQQTLTTYTKGFGRIFCTVRGYERCHNQEEIIAAIGYDSERDPLNPTGSVFCSQGAGFLVDWDQVKEHMHLESFLLRQGKLPAEEADARAAAFEERWISLEEIDRIFESTYYANKGKRPAWKRRVDPNEELVRAMPPVRQAKETDEEYLLVDGYNIIHAWPDLKALAEENMDSARMRLMDTLCNYQALRKCHVIVVFDAYRVLGHREDASEYHNIHVVFTREAQTADQYIERFSYVNQRKYHITVATSDGLQQMIVRGVGSALLSARELKTAIEEANDKIHRDFLDPQLQDKRRLGESLTPETRQQMKDMTNHAE